MRALLAVVLALALSPVASAGLPNACALLTNAEVAKAFGAKVANRTSATNGLYRGCTWDGAPPSSFTSYHASLHLDITRITRAQFEKLARKTPNAVPVHGLGEAAFSQYAAGEFLAVWHKGVVLNFALSGGSSPLATAKTLARSAVARL
jgi:hypothetical protein